MGEHHAGELRREHGENRAERFIREELKRSEWTEPDLKIQRENASGEWDLAARLRRETTMTVKWMVARVSLGMSKSANGKLHEWMKQRDAASLPSTTPSRADQPQLEKQQA
jgi:hypothetical protein